MATKQTAKILVRITGQNIITDEDVQSLRAAIFADGFVTIGEADLMFEANNIAAKTEDWDEFFIEAISVFLVEQAVPEGYINSANASWLKVRISQDGIIENRTELNLLLRLIKKAKNVTEDLELFALAQVRQAVLYGKGALGRSRELSLGVIGEAEVEMLRSFIYACAGDRGIGISRREAMFLFELNEKCEASKNHENWQDLFVGAIANHLMVQAGWDEPSLHEALRRDNWLKDPEAGLSIPGVKDMGLAFLSLQDNPPGFVNADNVSRERAEQITANEAGWLIERINVDGALDANERALLEFLQAECPEIHRSLTKLIDAA